MKAIRVFDTLGMATTVLCVFALACGGQSVHRGDDLEAAGGTGGTGGAGGTGGTGGTGVWTEGVHPDDAASVVVAAIGRGQGGASCRAEDGTVEVDGEPPMTNRCEGDSYSSEQYLVAYFCETNCTRGFQDSPPPPYVDGCYFLGTIGSIRIMCEDGCAGGACILGGD